MSLGIHTPAHRLSLHCANSIPSAWRVEAIPGHDSPLGVESFRACCGKLPAGRRDQANDELVLPVWSLAVGLDTPAVRLNLARHRRQPDSHAPRRTPATDLPGRTG